MQFCIPDEVVSGMATDILVQYQRHMKNLRETMRRTEMSRSQILNQATNIGTSDLTFYETTLSYEYNTRFGREESFRFATMHEDLADNHELQNITNQKDFDCYNQRASTVMRA